MPPGPSGQLPVQRKALIAAPIADSLSRRAAGEELSAERTISEHPDLMPELGEELAELEAAGSGTPSSAGTVAGSPTSSSGESHDTIPGYRIERRLSEGGQGVVYLAVQESTHRRVALKMIRGGSFAGRSDRARFEREVLVLGQLSHPNIVAIHDSGSVLGGHFFVMDYIDGRPLDRHMQGPGAPRSVPDTLRLFEKICAAINAAHVAGIIHRDLKPSNILVDAAGEPHILDFGLAKVPLGETDASSMTMTGHFIGSPPWAAPEQAEGTPGKIDMRTDVYSLGVILYQMLTGRFPYDVTGEMGEVLERILHDEPRRPRSLRPEIDDETETIVLRCLSKDRGRRYQTAGEIARDIRNYLSGLPIEAKRDSYGYLIRKQLKRHKAPVAFGAAFLVLVLAGLVTSLALWRRAVAEAATGRFRLEAARDEANLDSADYQEMAREIRRLEEILARQPLATPRPFDDGGGETAYRDGTAWLTGLLPTGGNGAPAGRETLSPDVVEAIRGCAGGSERSGCEAAFAWLRANQGRVAALVKGARDFHLRFGPRIGSGRLIGQVLPSLGPLRLAVAVTVAEAQRRHEDRDPEAAIEALDAAVRLSRYAGDGLYLISALVEIACRKQIYAGYRWMIADAARRGALPAPYLDFLKRDPPPPDYRIASMSEVRALRQILNETFVKNAEGETARLDLAAFRDLISEMIDEGSENPFLEPSESIKADARSLRREEAVSIVADIYAPLRSPKTGCLEAEEAEASRTEAAYTSHPVLGFLLPNLAGAATNLRAGRMSRDATVIAAATFAFRDARGRWPRSIDEALASFPVSPSCRRYDGRDFVLRIEEGRPLLYAVGPNGIDDGGRGRRFEAGIVDGPADDDILFLTP